MTSGKSSNRRLWLAAIAIAAIVFAGWDAWRRLAPPRPWNDAELADLATLQLAALPPLPPDPTNAVADDPRAAEFGHALFFDTRLSANGMVSCATCHQPERRFTDGQPRGIALGVSKRNTPSIVATAYSPWLYWDGRKDSQWAQALSPIEDPDEHGTNRLQVIGVIAGDAGYRERYESLFGPPPDILDSDSVDRAFANVGKAIAAYERRLMPAESRFDRYVGHVLAGGDHRQQEFLDDDEIRGLRLFIGKARCTECHNGPLLTNNEFHNTGLLSPPGETPDRGRVDGLADVLEDPFNCAGAFSDDPERRCDELEFVRTGTELIGATRTPSLRNLGGTAPFQSKGQFATLEAVLEHYNEAPLAMIGHNEATALGLREYQLRQVIAFLDTLDAPLATDPAWLSPPSR